MIFFADVIKIDQDLRVCVAELLRHKQIFEHNLQLCQNYISNTISLTYADSLVLNSSVQQSTQNYQAYLNFCVTKCNTLYTESVVYLKSCALWDKQFGLVDNENYQIIKLRNMQYIMAQILSAKLMQDAYVLQQGYGVQYFPILDDIIGKIINAARDGSIVYGDLNGRLKEIANVCGENDNYNFFESQYLAEVGNNLMAISINDQNNIKQTTNVVENTIKQTTNAVENAIKQTTNVVENTIKQTTNVVENTIKQTTNVVENTIKQTTNAVENTIKQTTKAAENTIKQTANVIENTINTNPVINLIPEQTKIGLEKSVEANECINKAPANKKNEQQLKILQNDKQGESSDFLSLNSTNVSTININFSHEPKNDIVKNKITVLKRDKTNSFNNHTDKSVSDNLVDDNTIKKEDNIEQTDSTIMLYEKEAIIEINDKPTISKDKEIIDQIIKINHEVEKDDNVKLTELIINKRFAQANTLWDKAFNNDDKIINWLSSYCENGKNSSSNEFKNWLTSKHISLDILALIVCSDKVSDNMKNLLVAIIVEKSSVDEYYDLNKKYNFLSKIAHKSQNVLKKNKEVAFAKVDLIFNDVKQNIFPGAAYIFDDLLDKAGNNLLFTCIEQNNFAMLKEILRCNPDMLTLLNSHRQTVFHCWARVGIDNIEIYKYLIDQFKNEKTKNSILLQCDINGKSFLNVLVESNNAEKVYFFLKSNFNDENIIAIGELFLIKDNQKHTLLHIVENKQQFHMALAVLINMCVAQILKKATKNSNRKDHKKDKNIERLIKYYNEYFDSDSESKWLSICQQDSINLEEFKIIYEIFSARYVIYNILKETSLNMDYFLKGGLFAQVSIGNNLHRPIFNSITNCLVQFYGQEAVSMINESKLFHAHKQLAFCYQVDGILIRNYMDEIKQNPDLDYEIPEYIQKILINLSKIGYQEYGNAVINIISFIADMGYVPLLVWLHNNIKDSVSEDDLYRCLIRYTTDRQQFYPVPKVWINKLLNVCNISDPKYKNVAFVFLLANDFESLGIIFNHHEVRKFITNQDETVFHELVQKIICKSISIDQAIKFCLYLKETNKDMFMLANANSMYGLRPSDLLFNLINELKSDHKDVQHGLFPMIMAGNLHTKIANSSSVYKISSASQSEKISTSLDQAKLIELHRIFKSGIAPGVEENQLPILMQYFKYFESTCKSDTNSENDISVELLKIIKDTPYGEYADLKRPNDLIIDKLLETLNPYNIHAKDEKGRNLLHYAFAFSPKNNKLFQKINSVYMEYLEVTGDIKKNASTDNIMYLLDDCNDDNGDTPLHMLIKNNTVIDLEIILRGLITDRNMSKWLFANITSKNKQQKNVVDLLEEKSVYFDGISTFMDEENGKNSKELHVDIFNIIKATYSKDEIIRMFKIEDISSDNFVATLKEYMLNLEHSIIMLHMNIAVTIANLSDLNPTRLNCMFKGKFFEPVCYSSNEKEDLINSLRSSLVTQIDCSIKEVLKLKPKNLPPQLIQQIKCFFEFDKYPVNTENYKTSFISPSQADKSEEKNGKTKHKKHKMR